jgi:hypothetical protein
MKIFFLILIQILLSEEFYPLMDINNLDLYKNKYNLINSSSKWPILNYLRKQVISNDYKLKIKLERSVLRMKIKKNYKYILNFIHNCFKDNKQCEFKILRKYLEFSCVIVKEFELRRYCDIINTISLLEYCSLNFLIDENNLCSIGRIKNIIGIKLEKCMGYSIFDDSINRNYCKLFIDRSIEFLLEILAILNTNDQIYYYPDIYKLLVDLLKFNIKIFLKKTNSNDYGYEIRNLLHRRLSNLMLRTRMKILKQIRRGLRNNV